MRRSLVASLLVLAGAAMAFHGRGSASTSQSPVVSRFSEVQRLRSHFDSVIVELSQATPASLRPEQMRSRSTLISWLGQYRDAGAFPHNDKFPDRAVPFFRDSRGALCAVAYLAARSGRTDLVDRIAATRNNAYILELARDTALGHWLDSVGLSLQEAARIQPEYEPPWEFEESISTEYAVMSGAVSGSALITAGFNVFAPSRTTGWMGLIAGGTAIGIGFAELDSGGDTETLATANIWIGVGAVALSVLGFTAAPADQEVPVTDPSISSRHLKLDLLPSVYATGEGPAVGLSLNARF